LIGDAFISYDRQSILLIKIPSLPTKQATINNTGQQNLTFFFWHTRENI